MVIDYLLLGIRWLHGISAVAWVGGGLFYWTVLRPSLQNVDASPKLPQYIAVEFGQLVALAMWVLVITGAVLGVQRLSEETSTVFYVTVLAVKITLSAWMFFLVLTKRRRRKEIEARHGRLFFVVNGLGHTNMTVVLGLIIFFLSDALRLIVERGLID